MNNKNKMKRLAIISLIVMGIMLVFAMFDAARMNRKLQELQKTVGYAQLFDDLSFPDAATTESADILYDQRCLLLVCHKSSEETRYVVTQIFKITKENDEFRLWCDICKLEDGVLSNPHKVNFTIEPMSYQRSTKLQEILLNIAATI